MNGGLGFETIRDDREEGRFRVHRGAFTSDEVLDLERKQIFDRCWLYLGHVSEVAKPGDFVTRRVGGRPLIFLRDRNGKLHVHFNACPHRGALVCREPSGKKRKSFMCPYHGWVFSDDGNLIETPGADAYPETFNKDGSLNLQPVPKFDEFRGFVFVNFDHGAETLENYLDDACEILDLVASQGPDGMEIQKGMQEYSVRANWKLLQENSADAYHAGITHSTYFDYIGARDKLLDNFDNTLSFGGVRNLGNGHAVSESLGVMPWGRPYARWIPSFGDEAKVEMAAIADEIIKREGTTKGEKIVKGDRNTLIFPNLVINDIMAVTVRTFYPLRPDYMEVNAWSLAPINESPTSRERRNRNFVEFLGPAGFSTPDDVEMLLQCQMGYANADFSPWNDISRGMTRDVVMKSDELQMRTFWRQWDKMLKETHVGDE